MISITFLGTGPIGGVKGKAKNRRRESSLLLRIGESDFLFDVTHDFNWQKKFIKNLKGIFLTHGHRDAIGGMAQLKNWWQKRKLKKLISLWAHKKTIKQIKKIFKKTTHYLNFQKIKPEEKIKIDNLMILPILVPHSIQPGFPTFAFRIKAKKKIIIYASDVAETVPNLRKTIEGADVLIIDGAMWKKKIKSHLEVTESLPELCKAKVKKIYLTQIGKTAPPHRIFRKKIKRLCSKAEPAHDGLKINLQD
jgi:ribonuclease BN (tRNA processing enzyme)